jgi:beta-N-acetylglucosaminidase
MVFKNKIFKLILSFILIVFIIGFNIYPNVEASSNTYKVYNLTTSGNKVNFGKVLLTTTNFEKAKTEMNKYRDGVITSDNGLSPLKIVAATRGQAQSFPYRKGKASAATTLNIYTNKALTSAHTYIPAHYMMYVYDYFLYDGRIITDIEIQGGRGYVEVDKIDIIPMIYIENGISISLGGNADYKPSQNSAYSKVPHQEKYRVEKSESGNVNEIRVYYTQAHPDFSEIELTYGVAPDYLSVGKNYYSPDGIKFYSDRDLKNRVGDKDYYSYFQWLPLRTMTNHKPEAFDKLLEYYGKNSSVMKGQTHHFIEQGLKYGMNPVMIFQQANLESAYGTSSYAINRNNLFGWGAVDSNPDNAQIYDNIGEGIAIHMRSQIAGYMNVGDWRHYGPSFGNKSAGITVKYASDPYYGIKVASMYYRMDALNGYKDYNAYDLSLLKDKTSYSVKKDATTNSEWYKTKSSLINQVIVNLGKENNRIKTTLWMPNYEGKSYPGTFPLNLFDELGYIEGGSITNIAAYGPDNSVPKKPTDWKPPKKELIYEKQVNAVVTATSLNLRESFTTSSSAIASIKEGTVLKVEPIKEPKGISWAKTTYNGKTGFVHTDYLKIEKPDVQYKKGDVNGDGKLSAIDVMFVRQYIAGYRNFNSGQKEIADVNNDGKVSAIDVMKMRRVIAGIDKDF